MKKWILLTVLQLGANGADAYFTNRGMHNPGWQERDPLAKPFTRNTAVLVLGSTAGTLGTLWIESRVGHQHPGRATAIALADVSGHTFGAAYTARHGR